MILPAYAGKYANLELQVLITGRWTAALAIGLNLQVCAGPEKFTDAFGGSFGGSPDGAH